MTTHLLKQFLEHYHCFSEDETAYILSNCFERKYAKNDLIFKANEKIEFHVFINKGFACFEGSLDINRSKVYGFRSDGMMGSGFFVERRDMHESISLLNFVCIENCETLILPNSVTAHIMQNFPNGERFVRFIAEDHINELTQQLFDRDSKKLVEQYINLERIFPKIHSRIPQYYIANYLGITQEHLSRIRKKRFEIEKNQD